MAEAISMAEQPIVLEPSPQPPSPGVDINGTPTMPNFGNFSLWVGDLDQNVNEDQLKDLFSQVSPVLTVKICKDHIKANSLGYGYVNFSTLDDAARAMEVLNFTPMNGKPMRIMHSHRDPTLRKSGKANLFIKNLDTSIDTKTLHEVFGAFGTILSCKVELDQNGLSKGFAYVQYEQDQSAKDAISTLNGMLLNDKQVYVGYHLRRQERNNDALQTFTNVYVKNLSESFTDEDLKKSFSPYGLVTSALVMKDESGNSKCFGFVNFESPDSAASAVENLNDTTHDDKVWFVGRAQKKAEREAELKIKFEQSRINMFARLKASNLYFKNLDDDIDEEKLKEIFSKFGTIASYKIMLDSHGVRKGCGFVSFSTPEEAATAINELNGKMVGTKPLYVAIAERKEERKAKLQAHFAQVGVPGVMFSPTSSAMSPIHHHPMRFAPHPIYFGHGGPGMPPVGFGFQPHFMPRMHPRGPPNFMGPFHLQRQGFPPHGVHAGFGGVRGYFPIPQMGNNRNGGRQNVRNASNGQNVVNKATVSPMSSLASSLADASPDVQHVILGEQLYPMVARLEPEYASKVTGMLLEMDQTEVLHLVESSDALKKTVAEAMTVLRSASLAPDVDAQVAGE